MAAAVMTGNDKNCEAWIQANRQDTPDQNGGEGRRERRRSRE